jgi:hypothetical protein
MAIAEIELGNMEIYDVFKIAYNYSDLTLTVGKLQM